MNLGQHHFAEFFQAINGCQPFPWQQRMVAGIWKGKWPGVIALPTASGKTAVIDIAVFAMACGVANTPRRVFLVVDRRIVVDQASQRAEAIAAKLLDAFQGRLENNVIKEVATRLATMGGQGIPLVTSTMRGGVIRDDNWVQSPAQPAVCSSTVDQVGSRLLFRGYGLSNHSFPIHAGLTGKDAMIILDEAHCSVPFGETVLSITGRYQQWAETSPQRGLSVVRMSATPDAAPDLTADDQDKDHPVLGRRLAASKQAKLLETANGTLCAAAVREARQLGKKPGVIGIVVNRVNTARSIFNELRQDDKVDALLLTGRSRPWDRDGLLAKHLDKMAAGRTTEVDRPTFVVATQCIEVGADLDFDSMVTECASIDALRQRFGRLNRLGLRPKAPAVIVYEKPAKRDVDPIYGTSSTDTWKWLKAKATNGRIDMGVSALVLPDGDDLSKLCAPVSHAPVLLPAHLDYLSQTSPVPVPSPDVSIFLHGPESGPADVHIVWRRDLDETLPQTWLDLVAWCPPSAAEMLPLPIYVARKWLGGQTAEMTDIEGRADRPSDNDDGKGSKARTVLRWRGLDDSEAITPDDMRPGDVLVVPSTYGGCDPFGWSFESTLPVVDLASDVAFSCRGRAFLRLDQPHALIDTLRRWTTGDDHDGDDPPKVALSQLAEDDTVDPVTRSICRALASDPRLLLLVKEHGQHRWCAITGTRRHKVKRPSFGETDFTTIDDRSSRVRGKAVTLSRHNKDVSRVAAEFARACGLPDPLIADLELSGLMHDIGKADPRFQLWLHGGNELLAALAAEPLAKSTVNVGNPAAMQHSREVSGYPKGGRHELQSVALASASEQLLSRANDRDLVLHLIASHHGRCRPFAPVIVDDRPVPVSVIVDGGKLKAGSDHNMARLDSDVSERYWSLVKRYGWHGLAYLEAILRLADWKASADAEEGKA